MAYPSKTYPVPGVPNMRRTTEGRVTAATRYYGSWWIGRKHHRPALGNNLELAKQELAIRMRATRIEASSAKKDRAVAALLVAGADGGPYTLAQAQLASLASLVAGGISDGTYCSYTSKDNNALARWPAEKVTIDQITKAEIKEWVAKRALSSSPTTANRDLTRLAQVLDWALDAGWIQVNHARRIKKYQEPEGRSTPFTDQEEEEMRVYLLKNDPELWRMIRFAALTGLRQAEQYRLRKDRVKDGHLHLKGRETSKNPGDRTKTGRGRIIPLLPEALEILEEQFNAHPDNILVFPRPDGRPYNKDRFHDRWRKAFNACGFTTWVWHDLRHTFCSRLRQGGAPLEDIADLAGHSSLAVTRRYAHHSPAHLQKAMLRYPASTVARQPAP